MTISVKVNDKEVLQVSDADIALLGSELLADVLDDVERRVAWIMNHKLEQTFRRFKEKWEPVLVAEGAQTIPAQRADFVNLIVARPDYKTRAQIEAEIAARD
jgi:hypothetical protein